MADREDRYRAPALDKGLDILELLSEQPRGMTRGELVRAMGRGPSEIYRMLERLVARDYVTRSPEGDRYALSMKLFVLAHRHPPVRRLVARALPLMDAFTRAVRQSCHLVAPERDASVVVAHASSPGNWEFGIRVGAVLDLLGTGSGVTLLAFMAPQAREDLALRWAGTPAEDRFAALSPELESCRRAGYRVGDSRQIAGVVDVSAPILSPDGHAIAVITAPFIRLLDGSPGADLEDAVAALRDTAAALSLS